MIIEVAGGGVLGIALALATLMLIAALALAAWRLLTGPTLPDRVVALDLVSGLLVVFLVLFRMVSGIDAYMYVGIGLALIAFLATVAFAHYIERARGTPMWSDWPLWSDWLAAALVLAGGFFCLVAGIGVVRLNDVYARMHAATKAGTLGLALICLAVIVKSHTWLEVVEAGFVFLFMIASAPIGAHVMGRAAFRTFAPEDPKTRSDPACDTFRPSRRR